MILNRTSWHYKVYAWWWGREYNTITFQPELANLCPYVRTVLLWAPLEYLGTLTLCRILGLFIVAILGLCLALVVLSIIILVIIALLLARWTDWLGILGTATCGFLMLYLVSWLEKRRAKHDPNTTWNLAKSYIQSWHNRICPYITFE